MITDFELRIEKFVMRNSQLKNQLIYFYKI